MLSLTPSPGNVDIMVASELVEAGRAMQNGYVSPERTTLIASTHRIYATVEKMQMADGRFDSEQSGRRRRPAGEEGGDVRHAQARAGERHRDQRGAVRRDGGQRRAAAARARPARAAIRSGGRGAEASLRGFAAGFDIAGGSRATPEPPAPPQRATTAATRFCHSPRTGCRTTRASAMPRSTPSA